MYRSKYFFSSNFFELKNEKNRDEEMKTFTKKFDEAIMNEYDIIRKEYYNKYVEAHKEVYEIVDQLNEMTKKMTELGFNIYPYSVEIEQEYDSEPSFGFQREYSILGIEMNGYKANMGNYFTNYKKEKNIYNHSYELQKYQKEYDKLKHKLFKFTKNYELELAQAKDNLDRAESKQKHYNRLTELETTYDNLSASDKEFFNNFLVTKMNLSEKYYEAQLANAKLFKMDKPGYYFTDCDNEKIVSDIFAKAWSKMEQEDKDKFIQKLNKDYGKDVYNEKNILNIFRRKVMEREY